MKTASSAMAEELCLNYDGEMILEKHSGIDQFLSQATDDEKSYFSFSSVRNPLDVAVSRYLVRKIGQGNKHPRNRQQHEFLESSEADFNRFFFEFTVER
jgi:hypothetical protein